jgi:hypothetical protein
MASRATVDVVENPQEVRPRRRGSQAGLIARNSGRMDESSDQIITADGTGTAIHTRPGTMPLYKHTERNGWMARTVSVSALPMLLKNGWREFCGDCDDHHLDRQGRITTDPNACKARDAVAVRVCPVCRKRVYDNMSLTSAAIDEDEDPNVIQDDAYAVSTPEQRTKLKLDLHLWIRHPEWAQANGVPTLPAAFREMVDQGSTSRGT